MFAPYLLLVDDNQDDVLLTLRTLRTNRCPLIVRAVYDGVQALEFLRNAGSLPVAVLLNPSLSGIPGDELVRLLRMAKRTESLPILLFTSAEDECRGLTTGGDRSVIADDYLTKPLKWTTFSRSLRKLGLLHGAEAGVVRDRGGRGTDKRLF